eukprot:TRINITY_DN4740_c0_g1_i1.p1 TRINITY_DN4740_c0_g1~~TRINITY_DN4740_c0_g1_i1.p1  ORF type:complete len:576 (-),score=130.33 TRINITY_DN4740_c0_g1_i1:21-1748(-)
MRNPVHSFAFCNLAVGKGFRAELLSGWKTKFIRRRFASTATEPEVLVPSEVDSENGKQSNRWKNRIQNESWFDPQNQRVFLENLHQKMGLESLDGWYEVTADEIEQHGGRYLLSLYQRSPSSLIMSAFPEHSWKFWRFKNQPRDKWSSVEHQRAFLLDLASHLKIRSVRDWYSVSPQEIKEHGGQGLLDFYRGSHAEALMSSFPEFSWKLDRFYQDKESGVWKNPQRQREFFDQLAEELGLKDWEDWYQVEVSEIKERGGETLLEYYNGTHAKALPVIYPEHKWRIWKFKRLVNNFWKDKANQRKFLEELAEELKIETLEDWYQIKPAQFGKHGAQMLRDLYDGVPMKAIVGNFPELPWETWRFTQQPKGYWTEVSHREFFDKLYKHLNLQHWTDWYQVSAMEIARNGGGQLLNAHYGGSPMVAIMKAYPEYPWEPPSNAVWWKQKSWTGHPNPSRSHIRLFNILQELVPPATESHVNYLHPDLKFAKSRRPIELDIFYPKYQLAFEYQGSQHFEDNAIFGNAKKQQNKDSERREVCAQNGITVIEVSHQWNGTKDALIRIIEKQKPGLLQMFER